MTEHTFIVTGSVTLQETFTDEQLAKYGTSTEEVLDESEKLLKEALLSVVDHDQLISTSVRGRVETL